MHGILFKILDRDNEPSNFQEMLMNSTKRCLKLLQTKKKCVAVSILAGDQWWPRTSGGRLRFVRAITYLLSQIRQFCKRKEKESPQKRLVKFPVWEAKGKQFS